MTIILPYSATYSTSTTKKAALTAVDSFMAEIFILETLFYEYCRTFLLYSSFNYIFRTHGWAMKKPYFKRLKMEDFLCDIGICTPRKL